MNSQRRSQIVERYARYFLELTGKYMPSVAQRYVEFHPVHQDVKTRLTAALEERDRYGQDLEAQKELTQSVMDQNATYRQEALNSKAQLLIVNHRQKKSGEVVGRLERSLVDIRVAMVRLTPEEAAYAKRALKNGTAHSNLALKILARLESWFTRKVLGREASS